MKKKGRVIIISGPSGSGKTTLYRKLLQSPKLKNKLVKSVSMTTRPSREAERHGRDYFFITPAMFRYKKRAGHFLESMKVFDHSYGTPFKNVRETLKTGKNILLCIDIKGARVVRRKIPDALTVFIKTPTFEDLKKRLQNRATEDARTTQLRLATARKELKEAPRYDYVVTNDRLDRAYQELEKIILAETA